LCTGQIEKGGDLNMYLVQTRYIQNVW